MAKLSDHVFPESVWKAFGEHVGEKEDEEKMEKLAWRRTQPYAVVSAALVSTVFGGAPDGATKRVRGAPK